MLLLDWLWLLHHDELRLRYATMSWPSAILFFSLSTLEAWPYLPAFLLTVLVFISFHIHTTLKNVIHLKFRNLE